MATQVPDTAICLGCGYSLRGLAESVCPECGRVFDPADRSTYRDRAIIPKWHWWAKPPRWWHLATITGITGKILWDESEAPQILGWFTLFCASRTVIPLLVLDYVARVAASAAARQRAGEDRVEERQGKHWRWCVTPLCIALVSTTYFSDWPLQVRFQLSRSAFEGTARDYLAGRIDHTDLRSVGLFDVDDIGELEPGVVYFVVGQEVGYEVPFVYRPNGAPTHAWGWRDMGSGWYLEWWP